MYNDFWDQVIKKDLCNGWENLKNDKNKFQNCAQYDLADKKLYDCDKIDLENYLKE